MTTRIRSIAGTIMALLLLAGCAPSEPIKIGLIAGLSDRGSEFGESIRDGVILAIEQQNQAGGINKRLIELVVRDDGQNAEQATRVAQELIALKPEIVIGPVTSSMAAVVVPMMNQAGQTLISPSVASTDFYGQDDYFFRVNRTSREAAQEHASLLFERGARRIGLAYDKSNLSFATPWVNDFAARFETLGGHISSKESFDSSVLHSYSVSINKLLAERPDTLLFVASSLDTARLCLHARQRAPMITLSASEWSASKTVLSEHGGHAVEGLLISNTHDRNDDSVRYKAFREAFKKRYQHEPESFSLIAYDTANIVIAALTKRRPGEDMKTALLKYGPYQGLQQPIQFNASGDSERKVFFSEIRNGQSVPLK